MEQSQPVNPVSTPSPLPTAGEPVPPSTSASKPITPQPPVAPPAPMRPTDQNTTGIEITYAGFGARFLAALIDVIIVGLIVGMLNFLTGIVGAVTDSRATVLIITGFSKLSGLLISAGYYVYFIGNRGQTPGKMALNIKVIKIDTRQVPGYLNAFLRETIGKFLSATVILLGYFWMLWDKQKQTWHDKIANTIVIKV